MRYYLPSLLAALLSPLLLQTLVAAPEKSVDALQAEFMKLKFGMFIHYNMETYHGVQWVEGYKDPATFDPGVESIDTDAWADAAKAAGMTYAVLTTKHVSGFSLWDSEFTEYDVMHPACPYKKDIVGQFVKSFTSRGIKVGLYYCWRHPGFDSKFKVLPPECDPATHTFDEQVAFQKKQIAELMRKYPECFYIWHDGYDEKVGTPEALLSELRAVRPDVLHGGNWWDWKKKGTPFLDVALKEMRDISEDNTAVAETCWTLEEKGWFWNPEFKTIDVATVLKYLATANARHSNLLLNVGPDRKGNILPSSVAVLKEVGATRKP